MIEEILRDIQFSLRRLISHPVISLSALATLALGIGANSAIFSVVNGVLLKPLPYPDSGRLVMVWEKNPGDGLPRFQVSPPNFADWREQSRSFEALAGAFPRRMNLSDFGESEIVAAAKVSSDFWRVFRPRPVLGRTFGPAEDRAGGEPVAVISHGLWRRRFAGKPEAIGKVIALDGQSYSIIGVAPPGFDPPSGSDIWVPLGLDFAKENRGGHYLQVFGRLKGGVETGPAQRELTGIAANLERAYPDTNKGWGADVISLHDYAVEDVRPSILILLAAVTAVLLMACMNVANLLLVQLFSREAEIAVRIALGSSRVRLIRQLVTEGFVLSLLGGALSLLLAFWGTRLLVIAIPALPQAAEIGLSSTVLVFALLISLASGLLVGILPALQSFSPHQYEALRQGRSVGGRRGTRTRRALVVAEIAFAVMLLIGAGLLIQSLLRLRAVDPGFNPQGVLTLQVSLPEPQYRERAMKVSFYQELLSRLSPLPGVQSVGLTFPLPLDSSHVVLSYSVPGRAAALTKESQTADIRTVTPGAFKALAIPLVRGRLFAEADRDGAPPVAVINKAMADREWPGQDPVGRRITFDDPAAPDAVWLTIVGVVGNIRYKSLSETPSAEIYRSQMQNPSRTASVVLRTAGDPLALSGPVRREIRAMDPQLGASRVQSMEAFVEASLSRNRSTGLICGIFAALALVLAAVGVYGVSSYSANQRAREVGIRMALGARRGDIVGLMVRQGSGTVLLGTALGVVLAFLTARSLAGIIYGVDPYDLATFLAGTASLVLVGLAANYLPARRIARTDPLLALKQE